METNVSGLVDRIVDIFNPVNYRAITLLLNNNCELDKAKPTKSSKQNSANAIQKTKNLTPSKIV